VAKLRRHRLCQYPEVIRMALPFLFGILKILKGQPRLLLVIGVIKTPVLRLMLLLLIVENRAESFS